MYLTEVIERLAAHTGHQPKKNGHGYSARCPAHDDQNPSLSINEEANGKILLHCFSGCAVEEVCSALQIQVSDLFPEKVQKDCRPIRTEHHYKDDDGKTLYTKIRLEPGLAGKKKSFFWERQDENGQIVKNLKGCQKILYRLPEVLKGVAAGKPIFLVEGEKDADRLAQNGLIATTTTDSLAWTDEFTRILKEADVVILYDYDKTGFARKDLLCERLSGKVKRLRVVDLPGLEYQESHGADISDWLKTGNTTESLVDIVEKTPIYSSLSQKEQIRVVTMTELLEIQLPKREMILAPFLPTQGLCLLFAKRGVGKTHVAIGIGYAIATGGKFLKWQAPQPRKVLYIDGEMPAISMQERLARISVTEEISPPDPSYFRLITPDLQEGPLPDLSTKEGRAALDAHIGDSDLIIVDNLSSLFRTGIENEAESWQPVQEWALNLRRRGKSILFIHHAAKGGQQRGTSKKEDILDTVINLKHPQGYRADQGACFEVHFEKTRHFAGDDAEMFCVQLREQDDGLWQWDIEESAADSEMQAVVDAMNEGLTIEATIAKTGLTKSQVETRRRKAKERGLID